MLSEQTECQSGDAPDLLMRRRVVVVGVVLVAMMVLLAALILWSRFRGSELLQ